MGSGAGRSRTNVLQALPCGCLLLLGLLIIGGERRVLRRQPLGGVQRLVCCMHSVSFGHLLSRRYRRLHPDAPRQILLAALRMVTFCCAASIVSLAPSPNRACDVVSYYTRF